MKLRFFLRGLGAGIVFTVLVLGVTGGSAEKETLTDNEIIARARELGMVTKDEKLDESLSQILDDKETQDTEKADDIQKVQDTEEADGTQEVQDTEGAEGTDEEAPESVLPEPLEEEETQVTSKITISPGMSSSQVANALWQLGLVDNAEEFDDYLCDNGYSSKIRVGTFTVEGKPGYEELVRIITTK